MALIIEDGSGVFNANSFNSLAWILAYLTERNRNTENSWDTLATAVQEAHAIAAGDYMENRFSQRFKGLREFTSLTNARSTLTFTQQPADTETVVIDGRTYTFNTVLSGSDGSVLIGASTSASITNLVNAINLGGEAGVDYDSATTENTSVEASEFEEDTMVVKALTSGTPGNAITSTTTVTGAAWTGSTLAGGSDTGVSQNLSFPRVYLVDRDGQNVCGVPLRVKQAHAEYAVRSAGATLNPDPTTDDRGLVVIEKEEVVGPIKERTKYSESGASFSTIRAYPAADRLLAEYLLPGGSAIRA